MSNKDKTTKKIIPPGFESFPERINRNGRPKGSKSRSSIVKAWLEATEKTKNPITNEIENLTQADIIVLAQIKEARKGSTQAFHALMDSLFGKIPQEIIQETEAKHKLIIERRIISGPDNTTPLLPEAD